MSHCYKERFFNFGLLDFPYRLLSSYLYKNEFVAASLNCGLEPLTSFGEFSPFDANFLILGFL